MVTSRCGEGGRLSGPPPPGCNSENRFSRGLDPVHVRGGAVADHPVRVLLDMQPEAAGPEPILDFPPGALDQAGLGLGLLGGAAVAGQEFSVLPGRRRP
jgi:hypothetical protein